MTDWDFAFIARYLPAIWTGLFFTLGVTFISGLIGTGIGFGFAAAIYYGRSSTSSILNIVRRAILGTPVLVLMFWLYYCLPVLGVKLNATAVAVVSLSINLSVFVADIIVSAMRSIPAGQIEIARVMGLNSKQISWYVLWPQVVRHMVTPITNEYITLLKLSTFASVIAVPEILYTSNLIITETYRATEVYTLLAFAFIGLSSLLSIGGRSVEKLFRWRNY